MMAHRISYSAVQNYTAAPSPTKTAAAVSVHNNIQRIIGDTHETFLQGSYRNNTGIADINDVDIVAIRKQTTSTVFTGRLSFNGIPWEQIFQEIQDKLEDSYSYKGKTERGDKCITVNTNFKADVVPAIYIADDENDPISVYSFREGAERKNFPRIHYQNNVAKHAATDQTYKPTVRMFKKWARNQFEGTKVAPSFYVECLVYRVPDTHFNSDFAESFFDVGNYIINNYTQSSWIYSVAGDKDILVKEEWSPSNFNIFKAQLEKSISKVRSALAATSTSEADRLWHSAFNG